MAEAQEDRNDLERESSAAHHATARSQKDPQARRPWSRFGHRQDFRPWSQGPGFAFGRQARTGLRRRSDADPHAHAQAAWRRRRRLRCRSSLSARTTQPVNVDDLERLFDAGATVNPETLAAKGLATRKGVPVKILGRGELTKKLDVTAAKFSAEAQKKIEAAGGPAR